MLNLVIHEVMAGLVVPCYKTGVLRTPKIADASAIILNKQSNVERKQRSY
jgi:Tfp pilus assembly protein PilE